MSEGLRPCPFCGAAGELRRNAGDVYFVKCTHCGARTRSHTANENGAIAGWNKRWMHAGICLDCLYFDETVGHDDMHRCALTSRARGWNDFCSRFEAREG